MSKEKASKDIGAMLASIDNLIPKDDTSLFECENIRNFTDWIYLERYKVDKHLGLEEAGEKITAFKDTSVLLVTTRKNGQRFPGSGQLREEFQNIMAMKHDRDIEIHYRAFRNKALSHVLLSDANKLPEAFKESALDIRETYTALYKKLQPYRTSEDK